MLEPAAVIGVDFPTPAVTDLAPAGDPGARGLVLLESMTDKQLVRPTGSVIVGYRFTHQLIRDTAYQAMLKRARATLHELYADWLTAHEADRIGEVEEVIGYHLEQAHLLPAEPRPARRTWACARRARGLPAPRGRFAGFAREDMHAAASLLRRAVGLMRGAVSRTG